jgi:hypothetical protein
VKISVAASNPTVEKINVLFMYYSLGFRKGNIFATGFGLYK